MRIVPSDLDMPNPFIVIANVVLLGAAALAVALVCFVILMAFTPA
jgi:hypothetical protein